MPSRMTARHFVACAMLLGCGILAARQAQAGAPAGEISIWRAAAASVLMAANIWLAPLRLRCIAAAHGHDLTSRCGARAVSAGFLAGSLGLSIAGQAGGNIAMMAMAGIRPASAAIVFAIERVVALSVLAAIALAGLAWLFGIPEPGSVGAAAGVFGVVLALFLADQAARAMKLNRTWLTLTLITTLAMHTACVAAWVTMLAPLAPLADLFACAPLAMLAAAVPVGLAGFGPREAGAVAVFGICGVSAIAALTGALVIGLASLAAMSALAMWSIYVRR